MRIKINSWLGKIKNCSQKVFFVLVVHISPCVVSVMAAAAADFLRLAKWLAAADLSQHTSDTGYQKSKISIPKWYTSWERHKSHHRVFIIKICIVFVVVLLYFKIFNFELFGHFWLIFQSQFSFFAIFGIKNSKSEKFYKM